MPSLVPAQGWCLVSVVEYRNISMSLHYSRVSWSPLPPCLVGHLPQKKKQTKRPSLLRRALAEGGRWGVGGVPSSPAVIYRVLPFRKHCRARLPKVSASVLRSLYEKGEEKVGNVSNVLSSWLRASHSASEEGSQYGCTRPYPARAWKGRRKQMFLADLLYQAPC